MAKKKVKLRVVKKGEAQPKTKLVSQPSTNIELKFTRDSKKTLESAKNISEFIRDTQNLVIAFSAQLKIIGVRYSVQPDCALLFDLKPGG